MRWYRRYGKTGTLCAAVSWIAAAGLALVLGSLAVQGWDALHAAFFAAPPSRDPGRAGIGPALAGTLWLVLVAGAAAFPVGIGAAIYLEEYAPRTRIAAVAESVMANLAGVPSVVYGVAGLAVFVYAMNLGASVLAGGLTLAVLALPAVITTSREAIRAVPGDVRWAAYGLGATRWQVVRHQVLPAAAPGILEGLCLVLTRAAGEAAPLLVVGAASFVTFLPRSPADPLTSLPTQTFAWTVRSQPEFAALAAGAALSLLLVLLAANLAALAVRRRIERVSP